MTESSKISKNEVGQGNPLKINPAYSQTGYTTPLLSKATEQDIEEYIRVSVTSSPFFQKGALYGNRIASDIVRDLAALKNNKFDSVDSLANYLVFSPDMQVYIELCARVVTDLALSDAEYIDAINKLQDVVRSDDSLQYRIGEAEARIDEQSQEDRYFSR